MSEATELQFDSLKDAVVWRAAYVKLQNAAECGHTEEGCWDALMIDFFGHDYVVSETYDGFVSVVKFDRGIEASLLFDEARAHHAEIFDGEWVDGHWIPDDKEQLSWMM